VNALTLIQPIFKDLETITSSVPLLVLEGKTESRNGVTKALVSNSAKSCLFTFSKTKMLDWTDFHLLKNPKYIREDYEQGSLSNKVSEIAVNLVKDFIQCVETSQSAPSTPQRRRKYVYNVRPSSSLSSASKPGLGQSSASILSSNNWKGVHMERVGSQLHISKMANEE
jgi:hypothetical protein